MKKMFLSVSCNFCNSNDFVVLLKETEMIKAKTPTKVVKCVKCGLTYLNPRSSNETQETYGEDFYMQYIEKSMIAGGNFECAEYLKILLNEIERIKGKGRLLEIGCAFGWFLKYAQDQGWEVQGVEVSEYAANYGKKHLDLNIYCGEIRKMRFEDETFDVVWMNHVLEHLPDPIGDLKEINRILKRNGLLVCEVPNEFENLLEKIRSLLGKKRAPYDIPSPHLYFFTPKTLKKLVEKAGFKVIKLATPRRNKDFQSKYFAGHFIKSAIYLMEEVFKQGPIIELFAKRL